MLIYKEIPIGMEYQVAIRAVDCVHLTPKSLLRYMPPFVTTAARYCPLELDAMENQ